MPTPVPITIGAPLNWNTILDCITTYWPDFLAGLSSDTTSQPITGNSSVILAMMSPPNMAERPTDIDGLTRTADESTLQGNALIFGKGPLIAADTFYFVISDPFITFSDAQEDCVNNFPALNMDGTLPDLPIGIGWAFTEYTDGVDHICTASIAARAPS